MKIVNKARGIEPFSTKQLDNIIVEKNNDFYFIKCTFDKGKGQLEIVLHKGDFKRLFGEFEESKEVEWCKTPCIRFKFSGKCLVGSPNFYTSELYKECDDSDLIWFKFDLGKEQIYWYLTKMDLLQLWLKINAIVNDLEKKDEKFKKLKETFEVELKAFSRVIEE